MNIILRLRKARTMYGRVTHAPMWQTKSLSRRKSIILIFKTSNRWCSLAFRRTGPQELRLLSLDHRMRPTSLQTGLKSPNSSICMQSREWALMLIQVLNNIPSKNFCPKLLRLLAYTISDLVACMKKIQRLQTLQ